MSTKFVQSKKKIVPLSSHPLEFAWFKNMGNSEIFWSGGKMFIAFTCCVDRRKRK